MKNLESKEPSEKTHAQEYLVTDDPWETIENNKGLFYKVVQKTLRKMSSSYPFEDLMSIAQIIFVEKMFDKYDPAKGALSTYILSSLTRRLESYLKDNDRTIRIPRHHSDQRAQIYNARKKFLARAQRIEKEATLTDVPPELIAEETGLTVAQILENDKLFSRYEVYAPGSHSDFSGDAVEWIQAIGAHVAEEAKTITSLNQDHEKTEEQITNITRLNKLLIKAQALSEPERTCFLTYYGLEGDRGKTFKEIGETLDVSHEQARTIFKRAARQLGYEWKNQVLVPLEEEFKETSPLKTPPQKRRISNPTPSRPKSKSPIKPTPSCLSSPPPHAPPSPHITEKERIIESLGVTAVLPPNKTSFFIGYSKINRVVTEILEASTTKYSKEQIAYEIGLSKRVFNELLHSAQICMDYEAASKLLEIHKKCVPPTPQPENE